MKLTLTEKQIKLTEISEKVIKAAYNQKLKDVSNNSITFIRDNKTPFITLYGNDKSFTQYSINFTSGDMELIFSRHSRPELKQKLKKKDRLNVIIEEDNA